VDALKQGIFDQKSWDAKETEKGKPNPAFRIRWGPGDILTHRPTVRIWALDEGTFSFTKFRLSAVENVGSFMYLLMIGRCREASTEIAGTATRTYNIQH
jgi:hypothetical protein